MGMKYLLLIYAAEDAYALGEREKCFEQSIALTHELKESGHYVHASPLELSHTATSVRVREGNATATDGPYAETREHLGGYYLVEAKDQDEAVEIAKRIPGARFGTVEVRPIKHLDGLPESAITS
jgi:hypothetical protein